MSKRYTLLDLNSPDFSLRMVATSLLNNQGALSRIALCDPSDRVRAVATQRVESQDSLLFAAQHDGDAIVRQRATARLTHQATLARIAESDEDGYVRIAAIANLDPVLMQPLLERIALTEVFAPARVEAMRRIMDPAALYRTALTQTPAEIRNRFNGHLLGNYIAAEIAVSLAAVDLTRDPDLLDRITLRHPTSHVRFAAAWRLEEPGKLIRFINDELDRTDSDKTAWEIRPLILHLYEMLYKNGSEKLCEHIRQQFRRDQRDWVCRIAEESVPPSPSAH